MDEGRWLKQVDLFQSRLGYRFENPLLLKEALTHASYANESGLPYFNERLEFLGDAVLELCVSERLYRAHTRDSEGELTRRRSLLVCESALACWAIEMELPPLIRLGRGLERQGGRENDSILADVAEAVWGALFLDGGYEAVRSAAVFLSEPSAECDLDEPKNAKTLLQEHLQAAGEKPPVYQLIGREGPDHASRFHVLLTLPGGAEFDAWDTSIKGAQMLAASKALGDISSL